MWRNWQTRRSQKPVVAIPWWFKSTHPHHKSRAREEVDSSLAFSIYSLRCFLCLTRSSIGNDQRLLVEELRINQSLDPVLSG